MSHWYGSMTGRGVTVKTKRGDKSSGLRAHIRSWDIGIIIDCSYNRKTNTNVISLYRSGGSNNEGRTSLITRITETLPPKEKKVYKKKPEGDEPLFSNNK